MSPTELTLRELRRIGGAAVDRTEYWNHYARKRKDLFGFVDVLAVGTTGTLAVQCTSGSNVSSRVKKIKASTALPLLWAAGWRVEVWGWTKKNNRYELRRVAIDTML